MGIPAIFLALLVKSQYFDMNRYEFDPNRTLSVLQQGRQFETRHAGVDPQLDEGVAGRAEAAGRSCGRSWWTA